MAESDVIQVALHIIDSTYTHTEYEDKTDAQQTFESLRQSLPSVATSTEGRKMIQKFTMLGNTATTEFNFKDMVKIIWRVVKPLSGTPMYRLAVFFLSLAATVQVLSSGPQRNSVSEWVDSIEKWLGKQLTIGGKGVVGDGEGQVVDRVKQFFSTPYLHEFD